MTGGVFPGDWSQLLSGLVSAAATGLLVAGVVSVADRRRQRQEAARDWERARRGIRIVEPFGVEGPTGTGSVDVPSWAYSAVQKLEGLPLPRWSGLIRDASLRDSLRFETLVGQVEACARDLEDLISELSEAAARTTPSVQTRLSISYQLRALAHGEHPSPFIPQGVARGDFEDALELAVADARFQSLVKQWDHLLERLECLGKDLMNSLKAPVDDRRPRLRSGARMP